MGVMSFENLGGHFTFVKKRGYDIIYCYMYISGKIQERPYFNPYNQYR